MHWCRMPSRKVTFLRRGWKPANRSAFGALYLEVPHVRVRGLGS